MTDSHCHLASYQFPSEELPDIIQRAHDTGVHRLITLATSLDDIPTNISIAETFDSVHSCIGIHPCDVHETDDDFAPKIEALTNHSKVAAIGETGLDYFHPAPEGWTEESYHARQRHFLHQHFEIAAKAGLNIVIHTRDKSGDASFQDALAIYRDYADRVKAVFHCFISSVENAQLVLDLGGYLSFTGIATFKKPGTVLDVAKITPAGRFMVETDSPYLAPIPYRGKRNEPAYVTHTAAAIASARDESLSDLTTHTERATKDFFRI